MYCVIDAIVKTLRVLRGTKKEASTFQKGGVNQGRLQRMLDLCSVLKVDCQDKRATTGAKAEMREVTWYV